MRTSIIIVQVQIHRKVNILIKFETTWSDMYKSKFLSSSYTFKKPKNKQTTTIVFALQIYYGV